MRRILRTNSVDENIHLAKNVKRQRGKRRRYYNAKSIYNDDKPGGGWIFFGGYGYAYKSEYKWGNYLERETAACHRADKECLDLSQKKESGSVIGLIIGVVALLVIICCFVGYKVNKTPK